MCVLYDSHNHIIRDCCLIDGNMFANNEHSFMIINSTAECDWAEVVKLSEKYSFIIPALGVHPWSVRECDAGWDLRLNHLVKFNKKLTIGECGLDFSRKHKASKDLQLDVFEKQLVLAINFNRPTSIHCVNAWGQLIDMVIFRKREISGVIHSFTGSVEVAKQLINMGFFISFSPATIINIKRKLNDNIRKIPIEKILVESDYSSNGSVQDDFKNSFRSCSFVATHIAEMYGISFEELRKILNANFKSLFYNYVNTEYQDKDTKQVL